jgi:predicted AlkP superfamily pyrophosphatase or phosphodiesterase
MQKSLAEVDAFARDLHKSLKSRNLTDIADIIFVSDHGMTDTSHPEMVYMDDILGQDGLRAIEHEDGSISSLISAMDEAYMCHRLAINGPTILTRSQCLILPECSPRCSKSIS